MVTQKSWWLHLFTWCLHFLLSSSYLISSYPLILKFFYFFFLIIIYLTSTLFTLINKSNILLLTDKGGERKRPPLPKICHTYPTKMKLGTVIPYLKKIQIYMNHVTHPMSSADISIFHQKSVNFAISRNTDIECILIYNF